jgi:hypothetical protein
MSTEIRTKYHIGINGKGFMLRGAPTSPRYVKEEAPSTINQINIGNDISYASLNGSGWNYWSQSDWSGGFQQLKHKDDGSFKDGQAIDVVSKYGELKLQNNFTSAYSISGFQYATHGIIQGYMLVGFNKPVPSNGGTTGNVRLRRFTSANAVANIVAGVDLESHKSINVIERHKDYAIIGMSQTSAYVSGSTLYKYDPLAAGSLSSSISALSYPKATNQIVRSLKSIGIRMYLGERIKSMSGDIFSFTTDFLTYTSAFQAGKGRTIPKIEELAGIPYFFIEEANTVEMFEFNESTQQAFSVYKWSNLTNWGTTHYLTMMVITGKSNGKSVAFAFNGSRLWEIFDDQLLDSSYDFSKPFEFQGNLQTKGAMWDGQFWFPGIYGKYSTAQYTPFANFANKAYAYAITAGVSKISYLDTTKFAISGNVVSSEFGSQIGGVDKLVNSVNINTKALATGQTVEMFKSVDGGSSFSSIGKMNYANDGAVTKKLLYFPSGFVTKLWNYKATLVGPGTTTPTVLDVTFEYRPIPDLKKRWTLSIDAGDDVLLLNKQQEQRDGKSLMSELWLEKSTKRTVIYEDVDSFEANLVSAMTKTDTSARVNGVRLMPPKGRMRVLTAGVAEEMIYTSADGGTIKGITRGQKGTLARAYSSANKFDNNYSVIVSNIKEQINDTDQNTTESVAQVVLLEV